VGHITLADSSDGMLAVLERKIASSGVKNMNAIKLDLANDSFPNERYHLICTLMTLHHVDDTDKMLKDFYKMLAKPGYLCVADLDSEDGTFHGADFSGHKGFDRSDLRKKVLDVGFQTIHFSTVFRMTKEIEGTKKEFPLFLMIAEKR
jgi:ubiquinone/menaquinone biosynthesis C-methylase UbiE